MPPIDQIEIAERIVRVETKLDFLIGQIEKLPPSPTCTTFHNQANTRLASLEGWRNRAVGALLIVNIFVVVAIEKIMNFFGAK